MLATGARTVLRHTLVCGPHILVIPAIAVLGRMYQVPGCWYCNGLSQARRASEVEWEEEETDRLCKSSGVWGEHQLCQHQQAWTPPLIGNNVKHVHLRPGPLSREGWFLHRWCWENWAATCRKMKLYPYLRPFPQINSKQRLKHKTCYHKTPKKTGVFWTLILAVVFLDMKIKAWATNAKINEWDYLKLKSFCIAKGTFKKMKRQPMD